MIMPIQVSGKNPAFLFLREFKNSRTHGLYKMPLPPELLKELKANLVREPRDYLFQDRRAQPFSGKSFSAYANRILQRVFDRPRLSLTILRHSFLSALNLKRMSTWEREFIAAAMCHTTKQQEEYVFETLPGAKTV